MSPTPSTATHTDSLESANGTGTEDVQTSLVAGVGDQCTNCGARLAPEQRYCVECGERRGQSRMPFADAVGTRPQEASAPPPRKRPRLSANAAWIAGVGTLVLALGVGVLIGRSGNHGSGSNATPQVITVSGGGSGTTGAQGATNTTASTSSTKSTANKSKKSSSKKRNNSNNASNPGAAVAGGKDAAKQHLPPATVKVGQPGHGRGYKNGKFTGDFFGQ